MPEFLPDPDPMYRDRIKEKLERMDMYRRRACIDLPEFYVGKCTYCVELEGSIFLTVCQNKGYGRMLYL